MTLKQKLSNPQMFQKNISPKTFKKLSILGSVLTFALIAGLQSVLLMYKKATLRLQTLHGVM